MRDCGDNMRNEAEKLLDNLVTLLKKQIRTAQQGKLEEVETLSEQVRSVSAQVAETGVPGQAEFIGRRRQIKDLHEKLCLVVAAEKAQTAEQLRQIRRYKKSLNIYRNSV